MGGVLVCISLVGFADATYLTIEHYTNESIFCAPTVGETVGSCDKVTDSIYAQVYGIPVALFGGLYYLLIFIATFFYLQNHSRRLLGLMLSMTTGGIFASAWFVYLQLFVLHTICLFCMVSALCTTILFGTLFGAFLKSRQRVGGWDARNEETKTF